MHALGAFHFNLIRQVFVALILALVVTAPGAWAGLDWLSLGLLAASGLIGILMGVLGGSFFPITGSGLLGRISDLTPTAAFIRGLGITSGGGQVADLGGPLAVFAAFGVGALAISMALGDDTALT